MSKTSYDLAGLEPASLSQRGSGLANEATNRITKPYELHLCFLIDIYIGFVAANLTKNTLIITVVEQVGILIFNTNIVQK